MAATPKHRRSSQKKRSTRASNRYDVALTKARKVKKNGGKLVQLNKKTGKYTPSHMVSKENPEYKGIKVISKKSK
jgi:ribosomal protein L32